MELNDFWAKLNPRQSVVTHGFVSGKVAQFVWDDYISAGMKTQLQTELQLSPDQLRAFLGYLVSLHDIGKIEYCFQSKDPETKQLLLKEGLSAFSSTVNVRHERTGQQILSFLLWEQMGEDREARYLFSAIIGAHHQGKHGGGGKTGKRGWSEFQSAFEKKMRHYFLEETTQVLPVFSEDDAGKVGAIVLAIMILSDWIASGPAFANAEEWIGADSFEAQIEKNVASFFERSGLSPVSFRWPICFCDLWPNIPHDGMRPLQREAELLFENSPDRYRFLLIEAPMGEGKTEAGVYAALRLAEQWGKNGFYLALPTAATANQMVDRMRSLLKQHHLENEVHLLHSMAWLEHPVSVSPSGEESDGIANWLAPIRRGLLGQFAVGTVDQAMLAATTVKYGALRLLGLSNKVLIIDEIHSYDAYMSEIIVRLLEWCAALEIPVVMLSATLPPEKKQMLLSPLTATRLSEDYPLITAVKSDGSVCERVIPATSHRFAAKCELLPILLDPEQIARAAIQLVDNGGCVCVLMNTVKEAQVVYTCIRKIYCGDLLLFHSQFTAERRAEIESACISRYGKDRANRPRQSILVATQVVEQSLDVDFDALLTAVAPIDLLIQRLGRVHRHDGAIRPSSLTVPSIHVLIPEDENSFGPSHYVYPDCLLKSSIRILRQYHTIRVPEDIAKMVREGYSPEIAPESELELWMERTIKEQVEAGAGDQFLINAPDKQYNALYDPIVYEDNDDYAAVATRLSEPSVRLALLEPPLFNKLTPFLIEKNDGIYAEIWSNDLAKEVLLQSVSVKKSRLKPEKSHELYIQGAKLLSGVWIVRITDGCCQLGNGLTLRNDPELGLIIKEGET